MGTVDMSNSTQAHGEDHRGEWSEKVAFITGVARGQGRSHALEFARRGADIGGLDICGPIATVPYDLAVPSDLEQTAQGIESLGRRAVLETADVRDPAAVRKVVAKVLDTLGRIDVVLTNAGVFSVADPLTLSAETWQDVLDVNLTGVWNTVQACLPAMVGSGNGGSIVMTSSIGGVQGLLQCPHYVASKHGVIGLMRALANELAPHRIRVNAVCPTNVNTPMIQNQANYRTFRPDLAEPQPGRHHRCRGEHAPHQRALGGARGRDRGGGMARLGRSPLPDRRRAPCRRRTPGEGAELNARGRS